jgi:hypothetical protein
VSPPPRTCPNFLWIWGFFSIPFYYRFHPKRVLPRSNKTRYLLYTVTRSERPSRTQLCKLTDWLTSSVVLEKLTVARPVKTTARASYDIRMFINVFTTARHWQFDCIRWTLQLDEGDEKCIENVNRKRLREENSCETSAQVKKEQQLGTRYNGVDRTGANYGPLHTR